MRLLAAYLIGSIAACCGAGVVIGIWGQLIAASHEVVGNLASILKLPLMLLVTTAFSIMLGIIPSALAMLLIGLPIHVYLVRTGRTSVSHYMIAGGISGFTLAFLISKIGHASPMKEIYEVGIVGGAFAGAIFFRLIVGDRGLAGR